MRERGCRVNGDVKGLVLLGRGGGTGSDDRKGLGDERRTSWEWLREDGTGGGGGSMAEEASGEGVEREEDEDESMRPRRADRDEGSVLEEEETVRDAGTEGGARCRDEPLFRDWVVCQDVEEEEEERRSKDVSVSKGSGFHCASLWIPFIPLVWGGKDSTELTNRR